MIYAVYGFIFGLLIPYIARRFEKLMPATLAYIIIKLFVVGKTAKKKSAKYLDLRRKLLWRSMVWGLVCAAISYGIWHKFGAAFMPWHLFFVWMILLLFEIDRRMYILPDIITFPMLVIGFAYVMLAGQWVSAGDALLGALGGYFIPVIASFFLVWKDKDAFGGGDIKLLSVVGMWLGLNLLLYVILGAVVISLVFALIQHKRSLAFGPGISIATILTIFICL